MLKINSLSKLTPVFLLLLVMLMNISSAEAASNKRRSKKQRMFYTDQKNVVSLNKGLPHGCKTTVANSKVIEFSCSGVASANKLYHKARTSSDVEILSKNFVRERDGKCPYIIFTKTFDKSSEQPIYIGEFGRGECK